MGYEKIEEEANEEKLHPPPPKNTIKTHISFSKTFFMYEKRTHIFPFTIGAATDKSTEGSHLQQIKL